MQKKKKKKNEFCLDCGKNMFRWTKKNHLGHFDWNCLGSRYPIPPNTQNMAILAENICLRLKVMLRGSKLWVNLTLDVTGVLFRFIGTHFDHNLYIIRILIFFFFPIGPHWAMQKFWTPPKGGSIFFIDYYLSLLFVTPFNVLEVGRKLSQNCPIYHPSLTQVWCW